MRTDGSAGTYEWWYFDSILNDGSKLVIAFYTKPFTEPDGPLKPFVSIQLDRADGLSLDKEFHVKSLAEFSAAKERCNVRIGPNTFAGDLHTYTIHAELESITADVTITGQVPSWRPETGVIEYGEKREQFLAWLPSVPQGAVDAAITIDGQTTTYTGIGYHDHNWGNTPMPTLVNHWYWGRGQIGEYSIIAANITSEEAYGGAEILLFMLAKDGQIVAGDGQKVQFRLQDIYVDETTGKPVAKTVIYDYRDDTQHYVVTFKRHRDLVVHKFIDDVKGIKHLLAWLVGMDAAYLRFAGDIIVERYEGDTVVETKQADGIWELMYFGKVHDGGREDPLRALEDL